MTDDDERAFHLHTIVSNSLNPNTHSRSHINIHNACTYTYIRTHKGGTNAHACKQTVCGGLCSLTHGEKEKKGRTKKSKIKVDT